MVRNLCYHNLDESWDHFVTHTLATVADITYSSLFETLCQEESRRSRVHSGQGGSAYRAQYSDRSSTDESLDEGFRADSGGSRGRFTGRMGRGRYRGGSTVKSFARGMGRGTTSRYSSSNGRQSTVLDGEVQNYNCYSCGKEGHFSRDPVCENHPEHPKDVSDQNDENRPKESQRGIYTRRGRGSSSLHSGRIAQWSDYGIEDEEGYSARDGDVALITQDDEKLLLLDSGATTHITGDKSLFEGLVLGNHPPVVGLGDAKHDVIGKGTIRMNNKLTLRDVSYAPNAGVSLISVRRLIADFGYSVLFDRDGGFVKDSTGNIILHAQVVHRNFVVSAFSAIHIENVNHLRLGHISSDRVESVEKLQVGLKPEAKSSNKCESCILAKGKRKTYKPKRCVSEKRPLDVVHSDVCGPFVESIHGHRYYVTFTDGWSRMNWTYPIKRKSDVFDVFKGRFKPLVENQADRKIKVLRTDRGGEYMSNEFTRYLQEQGIIHQTSSPYTPQQNGVSERMNRILMDMTRAMLDYSGIPHNLWVETVITASYIRKKGTWVLVEPDYNMNVISGRWVYAIKGDGKGNIVKLKARWVGRGFAQQHGIDYDETFAPTSHLTSVRLLLSIAAIENLELYQLDVRTAFLNAKLDVKTPVYIEQPHGFVSKGSENLVCRLQKALYGLKQAPRAWYHTLKEWLVKEGFEALKADESIYLKRTTTEYTIVLTHVDDMLVASNTMSNMQSLVNHMKLEFELSTVKPAEFFLGMRITRDRNLRTITIHQGQYVNEILSQFKMSSAEYTRNPLPSHTKIYGNWDPFDRTLYQKLVGKLLYLARCTRPDIATVVNMMCQFTQNPTYGHWYIGKNVMRYLVGKPDVGLVLGGECVNLEAYTDSTWASDIGDRKSRSGGIVYVGNGVVSWYSTKQQVVAKSSSEAEYVAMSTLASEVEWIRSILHELHYRNITPITINTDNRGARFMAENQVSTSRAKHIDIQYHYVKHLVELSRIRIQHVSTTKNVADVLTKGVNDTKHTWCCWMMGLM
ncbi:DNA-directed DNA polymerase [Synchytrium endobioticum]|uniref:DNA-directed DNA polymerase n=1 Tax=Synchytrium endobioticum TaxID=286115 RepID=A0A507CVV7_9FUNG|nr:DNA-directed DNA polymerase [Synchytrium endobioticum]